MKSQIETLYELEQRKVQEIIWSPIDVENLTVIDFGVGESTQKLLELGARVIAIDKDKEKLRKYVGSDMSLIRCDIIKIPFHAKIADLAVFYFTLHEIDPNLHRDVILSARRVSSKIMVVEPSPSGCPAYEIYADIWRRAMHSIGKFEDYQKASYWKRLIEDCGFKIVISKRIKQKVKIPFKVLKKIVQNTIKEWKKANVNVRYIWEMEKFLDFANTKGMHWSDLLEIIGISSDKE